MKVIGLLSWFDEPPETLVASIRALAEAGVEHVVAVDGRYALYRADHDVSAAGEYAAIILACRTLGLGCTVHMPTNPWAGGEVEKRTFMFALGLTVAEPGDWFWVQDADQVVTRFPADLALRLAQTEHDVAEVEMLDVVALRAGRKDWPPYFTMRALFRAAPITVGPAHCIYRAADGRLLWGWERDGALAPALDLTDVVLVEHRPDRRSNERQVAKLTYYAERDAAGIERAGCELCSAPGTGLQPTRWRMADIGPVAEWMECCDEHAREVQIVSALQLERLGIDPDSVVVENRNGRAPASAREGHAHAAG